MGYGAFVRSIRKKRLRKTAQQLADMMEVHPKTISEWENDKAQPSQEHLSHLLKLADLSLAECLRLPDESEMERIEAAVLKVLGQLDIRAGPKKSLG